MADSVKAGKDEGPSNRQFVDWYETFHEQSQEWRERWLEDRWFYHNKQWTDEEARALDKRGQPANVYNEIKPVVDFLVGLEKQQRTDPRAYPRTPLHEQDAEAATDALRFISDREEYDEKRSGLWFDMLTVGFGGLELVPVQKPSGEIELELAQNDWDRMWWDIHSSKPDFSDARYRGLVRWMDMEDAIHEYGEEKREAIEATKSIQYLGQNDTHDDKPRNHRWYDAKEKRVAVCIVYYQQKGQWYFAEFTGGDNGLLKQGPSPCVDDEGATVAPYIWMSAFVDPENERFGLVRELKDRQREINKRGSKLIHFLSTERSFHKKGAIASARKLKSELAKPDGSIEIAEHAKWGEDVGLIGTDAEVVGHFQLLQDAKESIRRIGASSSLRGQDGPEKSGIAIQAKQQASLVELGALMDRMRYVDRQAYRKMWMGVRQFWTEVKWVRVTDDERNVRFVALNVPQEYAGQLPQNVRATNAPVAEIDVDIIIEDAPDMVTLQGEQFEQLIQLASAGVQFPQEVYLRAAPNLRNKDQLIELLNQQAAQPNPQLQVELENKQADTGKKIAETEQTQLENALLYAEGVAGPEPKPEPKQIQ